MNGHITAVRELLTFNADSTAQNIHGQTPFDVTKNRLVMKILGKMDFLKNFRCYNYKKMKFEIKRFSREQDLNR